MPPSISPSDFDIPENGCGSSLSKKDCQQYKNCEYKKTKNRWGCEFHPIKSEKILFIGNSFTIRNNLPGMVSELAESTGKRLLVKEVLHGSTSFAYWSTNIFASSSINAFNDYKAIILQEQSQKLSLSWYRNNSITQGKMLYNKSKTQTENVILYETWGYKNGDPYYSYYDSFYKMQDRLKEGYERLAKSCESEKGPDDANVTIAYVGECWREAFDKHQKRLFDRDEKHPAKFGTYIAALAIYTTIFKENPINLPSLKINSAKDAKNIVKKIIYEKL